jgi:hypothetical protein
LGTDIAQIKNETAAGANSAPRVGATLENLKDSGIFEYDPTATYVAGQQCVTDGVVCQALTAVAINQPPDSTDAAIRAKWLRKIADTSTQIVLGNNKPVSANAVAELLQGASGPSSDVPAATEIVAGKARIATQIEFEAGTRDDLLVTPLKVKTYLDTFFGDLMDLRDDDEDGLNTLLGKLFQDAGVTTLAAIAAILRPYGLGAGASSDTIDDVTLRSDLAAQAVNPDAVFMSVLDSVGKWKQRRMSKADFISWIGTQAGSGALSPPDILLLADYFYRYIGNKEGWIDPATNAPYAQPTPPTLSGGSSGGSGNTQAVINFNASEYREGVGVIGLANNSFGDYFYVRVIGASAGATTPNSAFHLLDRIDGNFTNGTYAFTFATLPTGGLLDPGDYYVDIRIGSDNQTIVRKLITVASNVPYPLPGTENLKWVGPLSLAAGAQNVEFRIDNRYNNGTYQPYVGNITFYPLNAPAGVAFASATETATKLVKGYFSSDANAVSVATKITLVAYVGAVNIYLDITLQPAQAVVKAINGLYVVDVNSPNNDHNVLANVTQAVEVIRTIYRVINGAEQYALSDTDWTAMAVIKTDDNPNGDYQQTGTAVQRYYGLPPAGLANGNYNFYYTARPAGSSDTSTYVRHAPVAITINRGSTQPGPWRYSTTTTPAVLAIDYQWFKRTSPQRPDLYLYFKLSTADQYEVAVQVTYNGSTSSKSGYTGLQTGDYGNGYAGFYTFGNAITGSTYKLYIRKVGTTTDLLVIDTPAMPGADLTRTNFYTKP